MSEQRVTDVELRERHVPVLYDNNASYDGFVNWLGCSCGWNEKGGFGLKESWWAHIPAAVNRVDGGDARLREALADLLAHHDRQNGVSDGSPNDCEEGRKARAALASSDRADPAPGLPVVEATDAEVERWYLAFEKVSGYEARSLQGKRDIYEQFAAEYARVSEPRP